MAGSDKALPSASRQPGSGAGRGSEDGPGRECAERPPVVHVVPTPLRRGAQVFARALADRLDGPGQRHLLLGLLDVADGTVPVELHLGVDARGVPGAGVDPRAMRRLRLLLDAIGPATLVAHGGDPLKYLAPLRGPRALVYHAIGTMPPLVRRPVRRGLWSALASRAQAVVAVSDDVRDDLLWTLGRPPQEIQVIPNGRDEEQFRPRPELRTPPARERLERRAPVVAFVGRLSEGKQPLRFLRALAELRQRGMSLSGLVVGDGPLAGTVRSAALAGGVEVLGERADVADVLRGVDLLVFPSDPDGEGMPGVLIEAGLCAVPVIATRVAGVSAVVEDTVTGTLVPTGDERALCDALESLLGDPARREAMGRAARARCLERFSLALSARRWKDLLESLG